MAPHVQRRFTWTARGLTLAYMGLICVLSFMPGNDVPLGNVSDKYRHTAAYGLFAVLIGCSFVRLQLRSAIVAFLFASLFGVGVEFIQPTFHRTRDAYDALANAIGAALGGLAVATLVLAVRCCMTTRVNPSESDEGGDGNVAPLAS